MLAAPYVDAIITDEETEELPYDPDCQPTL